jgi:hypothetical protein
MTNLIHRSRTNGFYPVITHAYAHTAYDTNRYAYVKRMNLLLNSWNVPGINLLGPVDDGVGKWVTAYRSDDAHPNTRATRRLYYAIVPSLFDAILAGRPTRRNSPAHTALPACREQMPGRSPSPRRRRCTPSTPPSGFAQGLHGYGRGGHDGHQRPAGCCLPPPSWSTSGGTIVAPMARPP